jgi:DNA gyrase subunit B
MTDADVDGSHIRTLLLTFFFRQMTELVERGHLYIAQPPLYKAKRGKKELYLKDEDALREYLLDEGVEGMTVRMEKSGKVLRGKQIIPTLRNILLYNEHFSKMVHKGINAEVLKVFVSGKLQNGFADLIDLEPLAVKLRKIAPEAEFTVSNDPPRILYINSSLHSYIDQKVLESLSMYEYKLLLQSYKQVEDICLNENAMISKEGQEEMVVSDRQAMLEYFFARAKKGQYIQRYKGLGEMNPSQLWETTMDPEKRVLLQVKIEDSIEAEQIFTVLMGDQVEPRREFIEKNALNVSNLDV